MNLCDRMHEEICFNDGSCPLCKAIEEIDSLSKEIKGKEKEVDDLYNENVELKDMLKSADL